ncbi:MAG: oligosaccharide flippase family protein [Bacteroidales bacterium]|nr:oligosaccharide flippase family protein [Bacteroidales bacterium]
MTDTTAYKNIFKTTFLFGFVQVFNIAIKVGINKVVALILGAEGLGIISLFNTSISMIKNGCGLGINQSGVRDISEAYGSGNKRACSETIFFVKKIILYTCLFGAIAMIILSPILSNYSFGNNGYILSYCLLAIAVAATILNDGLKTILTGTRKLRYLAKASMIGSFAGLVFALPFYYLWGKQGIVPSLISSSLASLLISYLYVKKAKYQSKQMTIKEVFIRSSSMIKMGISLMLMSLMIDLNNLIISSYISNNGGLDILGYYQSGITIIAGYFGIIITAMSTDYYPRISAINKDNLKLKDAVNSQSEVGLIIALPLVVLFVFLSPYFLRLLYTTDFQVASQYIDYAMLGTVIVICSNCMGMVLLAKQSPKLFLTSSFLMNIVIVSLNIILYRYFGLTGLGFGYFFSGLLQFVVYDMMMLKKFSICFNRSVIKKVFIVLVFCLLSKFAREIDQVWWKYSIGSVLIIISCFYSLYYMHKQMHINPIISFKNEISKHL